MFFCCLHLLLDLICYFSLQDEELYNLFSGIANLESSVEGVRVIRDPHMSLGKGIAYVLFKTRVCLTLSFSLLFLPCSFGGNLQTELFAVDKYIRP